MPIHIFHRLPSFTFPSLSPLFPLPFILSFPTYILPRFLPPLLLSFLLLFLPSFLPPAFPFFPSFVSFIPNSPSLQLLPFFLPPFFSSPLFILLPLHTPSLYLFLPTSFPPLITSFLHSSHLPRHSFFHILSLSPSFLPFCP